MTAVSETAVINKIHEEAIMNVKENLKYSKSHEWVEEIDATTVKVGLTDFAQHELGDLVFVNLPEIGDAVTAGETFADVESVKAVSDVFSPVTGTVSAINEELLDNPAAINENPYDAWFVAVKDVNDKEELLDSAAYSKLCEEA